MRSAAGGMKSVNTSKAKIANMFGKTAETDMLTNLDVYTLGDTENHDKLNLSLAQQIELNKKEKELEETLSVYTNHQNTKVQTDYAKM